MDSRDYIERIVNIEDLESIIQNSINVERIDIIENEDNVQKI